MSVLFLLFGDWFSFFFLFCAIGFLRKWGFLAAELETGLEASLCTEIPLIVLDTLEYILRVVIVAGGDHLFFIFPLILKDLVSLFSNLSGLFCTFFFTDAHAGVHSVSSNFGEHLCKSACIGHQVSRFVVSAGALFSFQIMRVMYI